ncbi:hypothetical protein NDU88_001574, partial [Pleurodeles waltl]
KDAWGKLASTIYNQPSTSHWEPYGFELRSTDLSFSWWGLRWGPWCCGPYPWGLVWGNLLGSLVLGGAYCQYW